MLQSSTRLIVRTQPIHVFLLTYDSYAREVRISILTFVRLTNFGALPFSFYGLEQMRTDWILKECSDLRYLSYPRLVHRVCRDTLRKYTAVEQGGIECICYPLTYHTEG
jgi:hypothetical protein